MQHHILNGRKIYQNKQCIWENLKLQFTLTATTEATRVTKYMLMDKKDGLLP